MNTLLIFGSSIVILALIAYSIGIISEQITHTLSKRVMTFLTAGIILDVTATTFMILGSPNDPFTIHGLIGYIALAVMLIDVILVWRLRLLNGLGTKVPNNLHLYSRYAYAYWVIAFITGGLMVAIN